MASLYDVLGLRPEAEPEVVAGAYRALMQKYHPSTNRDADAPARVRRLSEAYAVLSDPFKRAEYDRELGFARPPATPRPPPIPERAEPKVPIRPRPVAAKAPPFLRVGAVVLAGGVLLVFGLLAARGPGHATRAPAPRVHVAAGPAPMGAGPGAPPDATPGASQGRPAFWPPPPRGPARRDANVEPSDATGADQGPGSVQRPATLEVVRGFYGALARGDGEAASGYVVPEKRTRGPFSASELTRYFSMTREPLRLTAASLESDDVVQARYHYTLGVGGSCDGVADVKVVTRGGSTLIQSIHARNGC